MIEIDNDIFDGNYWYEMRIKKNHRQSLFTKHHQKETAPLLRMRIDATRF